MSTADATVDDGRRGPAALGLDLLRRFIAGRPRRAAGRPRAGRDLGDLLPPGTALPQLGQPVEPGAPDVRGRPGLDRDRARAAAGRDRPLGRSGERPVRLDHGRAERAGRAGRRTWRSRPPSLAGTAIGLFQGSVFTRFVVPSFVVTLAGLLAWPGSQLKVLGETGTVNLTDPKITGLTSTFYSDTVGWIIAFVAIGDVRRACAARPAEPCGAGPGRAAARPGRCCASRWWRVAVLVGGLGPERRPRRAACGADPGGVLPVLLLHHDADHVRAPHLRGGRQRGGRAARRHQRQRGCG